MHNLSISLKSIKNILISILFTRKVKASPLLLNEIIINPQANFLENACNTY